MDWSEWRSIEFSPKAVMSVMKLFEISTISRELAQTTNSPFIWLLLTFLQSMNKNN